MQALDYTSERVMSCTPSNKKSYQPSSLKVVFCSGSPIGVPFLEALHEDQRIEVVGVMCPQDKAIGRGMKVQANVIAKTAEKIGVKDVKKPKSLRLNSKKYAKEAGGTYDRLIKKDIDILIVVAYGKIIPKHILDLPKIGPINVHGSLLPEYRGASPLQSVFLDGKKESGITIMLMDEGLDTGDMIKKLKTQLPYNRTVKDLINWITEFGPSFLIETIWEFSHGKIEQKAQPKESNHCHKIEKEDGEIEPYKDSLAEIYKKYQGYALRPKVFFFIELNNKKTRIIIESLTVKNSIQDERTMITGEADLHQDIKECIIKPEGKKAMSRQDFKRGFLTK